MNFFKWLGHIFVREKSGSVTEFKIDSGNKVKKALCMGINKYRMFPLRGCVNDAYDLSEMLENQYKFNHVVTMYDDYVTSNSIKEQINKLILDPVPDMLVITYSGHGSTVLDMDGDEEDGKDETWYLMDGNFKDDDIKKMLAGIPEKTQVIVFSDSCHSGTVCRSFLNTMNDLSFVSIPKYIPPQDNMDAIKLALTPIKKAVFVPINDKQVLLSGCASSEFSYDANINGRANGAFTAFAIQVLMEQPSITYKEFTEKLSKYLPCSQYPQTPQIECSNEMKDKKMFKCWDELAV